MKYNETYGKRKLGTGFYIGLALCLLIIGGASWFALAPLSEKDTNSKNENSSPIDEYQNPSDPYTESTPEITPEFTPDTTSDTTPGTTTSDSGIIGSTISDIQSTIDTSSKTEDVTAKEDKVMSFSMPVVGEVIKNHSDTELQYSETYGDMRLHTGLDIACKIGTHISACAAGTVTDIIEDSGLGNCVIIDHGNSITVKYASIENPKVKKGDKVNIGDIIGTIGTVPSECNDETHLHIEVTKDGKTVDPLKTFGLE